MDNVHIWDNSSADATRETLLSLKGENLPLTIWENSAVEGRRQIAEDLACKILAADPPVDYLLLLDAGQFLKVPSRGRLEAALAELPPNTCGTVSSRTYLPTARDPGDSRLLVRITHRLATEARNLKVAVAKNHLGEGAETRCLDGVELASFPVRGIAQLRGKTLLEGSSVILEGSAREGAYGNAWRCLYERLRISGDWNADDLPHLAFQHFGTGEATDLALDPLLPVERRYAVVIPELPAVSMSYTRQLAAYGIKLREDIAQLRSGILNGPE